MQEPERIASSLRALVDGDPWHGPPLSKLLADLTAEQASAKPVAGGHSIWELVRHVTAWQDVPRRRIAGEWFDITPAINWPPAGGAGDEAWRGDVEALLATARSLAEAVATFPLSRLEEPIKDVADAPTWAAVLHGVVAHGAWHGGQIALLRRLVGAGPCA
jgi:uncharacterized damage-inducible protein DinB